MIAQTLDENNTGWYRKSRSESWVYYYRGEDLALYDSGPYDSENVFLLFIVNRFDYPSDFYEIVVSYESIDEGAADIEKTVKDMFGQVLDTRPVKQIR